jgi:hypothetical protein
MLGNRLCFLFSETSLIQILPHTKTVGACEDQPKPKLLLNKECLNKVLANVYHMQHIIEGYFLSTTHF